MLRKIISMKRRYKLLMAGVLVLLIAAAALAVSGGGAVSVEKSEVRYQPLKDTYTEEGTVSSGEYYSIVSEVSGAVEEIAVTENAEVRAGDLLYRLDSRSYEYQKKQAESALEGYRASLEQSRFGQMMTASPAEYLSSLEQQMSAAAAALKTAETAWNAAQVLYGAGDMSRVDYEKASAEYRNAAASYKQAQARWEESSKYLTELKQEGMSEEELNQQFYGSESRQLEAMIAEQETNIRQLEDLIGKCEMHADRDGRISGLPVREMSYVSQGQPTVTILGYGQAGAEADVITTISPYLKAGDPVEGRLTLRGREEVYPLVISEIYEYAEKGVSALGLDEYRVHVKTGIDKNQDPDGSLEKLLKSREGYGIDLKFLLFDAEQVLTVPAGAVFSSEGSDYVFVIENGSAVRRKIESVYRSAGTVVLAEDKSEVHEGDIVIDQVDSKEIYEGVRVR